MKCANDLLLAKEETVLHGMVDRLNETGRCYEMEMNVDKTKVMRISREPSPLQYYRSETTNDCGIFQLFGYHDK